MRSEHGNSVAGAAECLLRILTSARRALMDCSIEIQLTSLRLEASRAAIHRSRPTTTRCVAGSVESRRAARAQQCRSPRRWPTVKWCTPACSPSTPSVGCDNFAARSRRFDALLAKIGVDELPRNRRSERSKSPGCRSLSATGMSKLASQFADFSLRHSRPAGTACAPAGPASDRTGSKSDP